MFGAMLPYLFAALTMLSVRKSAGEIIINVREQLDANPSVRETFAIKGDFLKLDEKDQQAIKDAASKVKSEECVEIATRSSLVEMVLPGTYAILCPIMIGLLVGPACLAGVLGGAIASGCMLGIMMSNAGGAWDNSKKYIEIECQADRFNKEGTAPYTPKVDGAGKPTGFPMIPKDTDHHKACVIGDTVGDPFKDTSGPALNILIKLMSMVSLTIAPLLKVQSGNGDWQEWYIGIIPLVLVTVVLVHREILTWKDP